MKALKILTATLLLAVTFTACKKDQATPVTTSAGIEGKWVGNYGYDNDVPDIYFSFNIKADGTLDELDLYGEKKGEGTWTITGNTFKATHHFLPPFVSTFISTATFDPVNKTLSGFWKYSTEAGNAGKWYMDKK